MRATVICCALLCAVLMSNIDLSSSECCHVPLKCTENSKSVERCLDCTEATVYCGKGQCNILGCNCDGGCRQGDSTLWCWNIASGCKGKYLYKRLLSLTAPETSVSANELINRFGGSDGQLSLEETHKFLAESGPKNIDIEYEFNKLDKNGDGFLSIEEIDN